MAQGGLRRQGSALRRSGPAQAGGGEFGANLIRVGKDIQINRHRLPRRGALRWRARAHRRRDVEAQSDRRPRSHVRAEQADAETMILAPWRPSGSSPGNDGGVLDMMASRAVSGCATEMTRMPLRA